MIGVVASSFVAAGGSPSYESVVLADSPGWFYKLDETAYGSGAAADSSGNARHGAYSTSLVTFGKPPLVPSGTCVGFGSGSQYVTAPAVPKSAQWTYEAWINYTGSNDANVLNGPADGILNIGAMGTGIARTYNYATGVGCHWTTPINDGQKHHLVAVQDATTLRLYVDGVERATVASAPAAPSGTSMAQVGGATGDYDAVAYYPYALSAARVAAHFAAGGPAFVATSYGGFNANTPAERVRALPAGAQVGDLLIFHAAGNIPTCIPGGTGWTSVTNGPYTITYKTIDAALLAAGQVTWTMAATSFEYGNAALYAFRGVSSVGTTNVTSGVCNTNIVSPASGAVAAGGLLLALGSNIVTATVTHNPAAAPWTPRLTFNDAYRSLFAATRPADTANVTCTWTLATWANYTTYSWNSTILRLLP